MNIEIKTIDICGKLSTIQKINNKNLSFIFKSLYSCGGIPPIN